MATPGGFRLRADGLADHDALRLIETYTSRCTMARRGGHGDGDAVVGREAESDGGDYCCTSGGMASSRGCTGSCRMRRLRRVRSCRAGRYT